MGVALAGGKTDKTCLASVEYFPEANKVFLARLVERIKSESEISSDMELYRLIQLQAKNTKLIGFDCPTRLPKCLRCKLKCPGFEACREPEIQWMWKLVRERNRKRRPKKLFTPYTERAVELYVSHEFETSFQMGHAMGSNVAPLTARAHFLARRLSQPVVEVHTRLSLFRIGRALHVGKSHLLFHRHSVSGNESRRIILEKLIEKNVTFVYDQDYRTMVENNQAFEAFIVALTTMLQYLGQCEERPKGFPRGEDWLAIPKATINW